MTGKILFLIKMALAQPIMTQFFSKSVNFLIRPLKSYSVNVTLFGFGWGEILSVRKLDLLLTEINVNH